MRFVFRLRALTHKSLADVVRRPARSLLVILGILIGVAGLTAIDVANDALQRALAYTANETQASNITFFAQRIDPDLQSQLAAVPNVAAVQLSTQYATRWQIAQAPGHASLTITAYPNLRQVAVNPFQVTQGHLPGVGEIVMDTSDSVFQPVAVGDTVTVETPHGPVALRVAGLSRTLGFFGAGFNGAAQAYMSAAGLAQLTGLTGLNVADVTIHHIQQLDQTTHALYALLQRHRVVVQNDTTDATPFGTGVVDGFFTIIRVLSLVALLLTALLIVNTVTTLVTEQITMIGIMKAMGGTRGKIMRGYLLSVLWYGSVGTVLGLPLGVFGGYQFTSFLASLITLDLGPFQLAAWVVLVSVLVGIGIPLLAALVPLWTGTAITVRAALAGYGISAGNGRARRPRATAALAWLPQTVWLGLRSLWRKRGRAILTLAALTLAGATFLAAQTTAYAVNQMQAQIDRLYPWDIQLTLHTPQPSERLRDALLGMSNVAFVEEQAAMQARTSWGTLVLQGFSPETRMYQHPMLTGRWFTGNESAAIVLSDTAVHKTHLRVGDTVSLTIPAGSETWTIIGIARDPSASPNEIGTAFVTMQELAHFTLQPAGEASTFLIQARDRSPSAVNTLTTTLDQRLSTEGEAPTVVTHQQDDQQMQMQSQVLAILLYAIAVIVAIAGMLSLANTLTTLVLERRREIGILRSLGATGWRVSSVFWVEGIVLALIAWGIGVLIGIPAAAGFLALISAVFLPIAFAFNPTTPVVMLALMLVIATIASIGPAFGAARMRIATILHYE